MADDSGRVLVAKVELMETLLDGGGGRGAVVRAGSGRQGHGRGEQEALEQHSGWG